MRLAQLEQLAVNSGLVGPDFLESLLAPLRDAALSDRLWRPVANPKGFELLAQGAPASCVFVLESGLVKLAYRTAEGGERIKSFIVDKGLFGPGLGEKEVRFAATTLEPSTTVALPARWLAARIADSAELQSARLHFEAWLRARKQAREQALLCDSAETRYRAFLRNEPELAGRLQQADIARFIGVTPIAFSRIKRRISA
jgi:CRP-like cAMP-binding protein